MGKPTGFLEYLRELPLDRSATERIRDWNELTARLSAMGRLITAIEGTADLEIGHAVAAQRVEPDSTGLYL